MPDDRPTTLPQRSLGTTGLLVTPICVGCAPVGSMPESFGYVVAEEQALATIRAVFDSPITFLDTAASYGDGESERRLGLVIAERGGLPPGVVLASKVDRDLTSGDFSGDQMRRSLERSLQLLGLERLQLCYLHDPEYTTFEASMAPGGAVEVLLRLKDEGLIEHLGVAGGPIPLMSRFVETGLFEVAIAHNRYSLLNVAADPFWDLCARLGVAAVNAAPYGGGMLVEGPRSYPRYAYRPAPEALLARAFRLEEICARYGVPLAAAALQFSLRDPRISSTIVGMSAPDLPDRTVELATFPIPDEIWPELVAVPPDTVDLERTA